MPPVRFTKSKKVDAALMAMLLFLALLVWLHRQSSQPNHQFAANDVPSMMPATMSASLELTEKKKIETHIENSDEQDIVKDVVMPVIKAINENKRIQIKTDNFSITFNAYNSDVHKKTNCGNSDFLNTRGLKLAQMEEWAGIYAELSKSKQPNTGIKSLDEKIDASSLLALQKQIELFSGEINPDNKTLSGLSIEISAETTDIDKMVADAGMDTEKIWVIVDGDEMSYQDFRSKFNVADISALTLIKANAETLEKFGDKARDGMLIVATHSALTNK
jgi:hypothetical protein